MILNDVNRIEEMAKEIIGVFNDSFIVDTYEFYASISIGISIFPDHASSIEELLKKC